MFTAKEIIGSNTMSVIEPSGSIRKSFFWYPDKEDKKRIVKLSKYNAFRYVKDFVPAFRFHKSREPDQDEVPYLIVQKLDRRVKVLGSVKDMEVSEKIFDWTLTTLEVIGGMAGDINTEHLIERVHDRSDLFTTWTLKFLPSLPLVESADDEGRVDLVPQRPLKDMDEQAHVCFQNGVVVVTKHRPPTLIPYAYLPPEIFVWEKQIRPANFEENILEEVRQNKWWDFLQNLAQEKQSGR